MRRLHKVSHGLDDGTWFVIYSAAASQLARIVIGERRRRVLHRQTPLTHQTQDIFRVVQHLHALQSVLLAEYAQTDRARCHQRGYTVTAEEILVVVDHLLCRIDLSRELERTAAAYAAILVGPPHILVRSVEYTLHGRQGLGRKQRHAPREVTDAALALRAVHTRKVVVAPLVGDVAHRRA